METALSIITTAYLRNEDILNAVEENLAYLNPPVLSVFRDFVNRVRLVDPDVEAALSDLREQIDNPVFQEWCDALCDCQYDRSLKTTLTPIVTKLSDMRVVNGELENMVFEPRKEYAHAESGLVPHPDAYRAGSNRAGGLRRRHFYHDGVRNPGDPAHRVSEVTA